MAGGEAEEVCLTAQVCFHFCWVICLAEWDAAAGPAEAVAAGPEEEAADSVALEAAAVAAVAPAEAGKRRQCVECGIVEMSVCGG